MKPERERILEEEGPGTHRIPISPVRLAGSSIHPISPLSFFGPLFSLSIILVAAAFLGGCSATTSPEPNNPNNSDSISAEQGGGGSAGGAPVYYSRAELEAVYRKISKKAPVKRASELAPLSKQKREVSRYLSSTIHSAEEYRVALNRDYRVWRSRETKRSKYKIYDNDSGKQAGTKKAEGGGKSIVSKYY